MAQPDKTPTQPQEGQQSRLQYYKKVLQSTYLYTIYLFFVRNFRKARASWNRFCKSVRRTFDPLYKLFVFKWLFPHVYKKHAAAPVDERKVVFVELRLPKLTNSFKVLYDTLYREYDSTCTATFCATPTSSGASTAKT